MPKFKHAQEDMETFDETDKFEAPWMSRTTVGEEVNFEVDRTRLFVEEVEPPFEITGKRTTIDQGRGTMRNINYTESGKKVDLDGEHVVPFWACAPLKAVLKTAGGPKQKKWVTMAYYREAETEEREDRDVTINTANFALIE